MSDLPLDIGVSLDEGDSQTAAPEGHTHKFFEEPFILTMLSPWITDADDPLRVYKSADFCFLIGTVEKTSAGSNILAILPTFTIPMFRIEDFSLLDFIHIETNGEIIIDTITTPNRVIVIVYRTN